MKNNVWFSDLSSGKRWAVLSLAEDWIRKFVLTRLLPEKYSCNFHCPKMVFEKARWPFKAIDFKSIKNIVIKAETLQEASNFLKLFPEHIKACKRIIGVKSERRIFWAFIVQFICVLNFFTEKSQKSSNITWNDTLHFGRSTPSALKSKEVFSHLWGERVKLTSMQIFFLAMCGISGNASIVESSNEKNLYLVLGPIAFVNASSQNMLT